MTHKAADVLNISKSSVEKHLHQLDEWFVRNETIPSLKQREREMTDIYSNVKFGAIEMNDR